MNNQVVERELTRIQKQKHDRIITAEDVVKAAAKKNSPLHCYFDWDDSSAAHKYRLHQARSLLVSYKLEQGEPHATRTRVSLLQDRTLPGGGYRLIEDVLSNEDLRREYARTALSEFKNWEERFSTFTNLFESELIEIERALQSIVTAETVSSKKVKSTKASPRVYLE